MFRKKNKTPLVAVRQSQRPNPLASATPDAINAAALAAIKQQQSNASLSSAAAAAALRSLTSTPVPVGDIQTKRMMRRGSTSSYGSAASGAARPGLQRQNSSSSMTERTFRSPSPSSRAPPPVPPVPKQPVPPLPRPPPIPQKSHKRASSLEPSSPRGPSSASASASASPATRATVTTPKQQQSPASVAARLSALGASAASSQNSPRPGSINFSRPMSPTFPSSGANASPQNARPPGQNRRGGVPARPATSLGFSSTETRGIEQSIQKASRQPVKTKKMAATAEGTHFSNGVVAPSTKVTDETASTKASALKAATKVAQSNASSVPNVTQPPKVVPRINTAGTAPPKSAQATPANTNKAQTSTSSTTPSPSKAQIEAFQARAAAMTARPRSSPADAMKDEAAKKSVAKKAEIPPVPAPIAASAPPAPATSAAAKKVSPVDPSPKQHVRSVSSPIESKVSLAPTVVRTASISPARSAHFSDKPVVEASIHKPPARAISPMKSALKVSSRTASPAGSSLHGSGDVSETRSDDESAPLSRKRKSAKVSFDEEPMTVGQATTPLTPDSPLILSPQNKPMPPSWSENESDGMSPRPVLPFFGSVRERKVDHAGTQSLIGQAIAIDTAAPVGLTAREIPASDGGVNDLVTPTQNGNISSSLPSIAVLPATPRLEDDEKEFGATPSIDQTLENAKQPELNEIVSTTGAIPASHRQHDDNDDDAVSASGSETSDFFSDAAEDQNESPEGGFTSLNAILESPISEEVAPSGIPHIDSQTKGPLYQGAAPQAVAAAAVSEPTQETDWNEARKYWSSLSEQKREQMEAESIPVPDASADVPVATTKTPLTKTKVSSSSSIPNVAGKEAQPPLPPWPDKQYQDSVKKSIPAKPTTRAAAKSPTSDNSQMRKSMRTDPERPMAPTDNTNMRKSMRSGAPPQSSARPPLEKIREAPRPMSTSSAPKNKVQKGTRPTSAPVAPSDAVILARAIAAKQAAYTPTPTSRKTKTSRLGRSTSNASDESESSFRKRRSSVSSADGHRYSMKRSMRGAPPVPSLRPMSPMGGNKPRLSLRPMSPSGSSMSGQKWFSKRDSVDSDVFSLDSNQDGEKKSRFGFRKSKPKAEKPEKPASKFSSRFADSSDEDEPSRPTRFRSRFVDSDDEDEIQSPVIPLPQNLTPVRGIPRKKGQEDADSTDLEDSDEDVGARRAPAVEAPTAVPPHANGTAESPASLPNTLRKTESPAATKPKKAKRGFFGFGRKDKLQPKSDSPQSTQTPTKIPPSVQRMSAFGGSPESVKTPTPARPSSSRVASGIPLPMVDAATMPTASAKVPQSPTSPTEARPSTPSRSSRLLNKLGGSPKTDTPPRHEWPAPPPIPDSPPRLPALDWDRPSTSDGLPASASASTFALDSATRPAIGNKRISSLTVPSTMPSTAPRTEKPVIVSARTGKKKKFQGLRRAFGLDD